jgi:hypothetical protein
MLNEALFMWKVFIEYLYPPLKRSEPPLDIISDITGYYSSLDPEFLDNSVPWPTIHNCHF